MATRKTMDLLTAVEQIMEKAKGTGLSSEFYRKADRYIKYVASKMKLTKEQSVMMALFIDNSSDTSISISDFSKFLNCRTTRILRYMSDIDVLEKRELVRCCRESNSFTYRVPIEVIEAFKKDEMYVPKDCSGLSCQELFAELEEIFNMRYNKELKYEAAVEKIHHLFNCNDQLLFVRKVKSYDFQEGNEMLLILFSHLFVNNNDDNIRFRDVEFFYEYRWDKSHLKLQLNEGSHVLFEEKLIEYNNEGGFVDRDSMRMTSEAKRELFDELGLSSMPQNRKRGDMVRSEDIIPKKLFYEEKIDAQITELGKLLDEEQYKQVHSRMKEKGFRCGLTCLFYGSAGTGKTETVLQLARQTGRDILQVNISQIKSMWSVKVRRISSRCSTITAQRLKRVTLPPFYYSMRLMLLLVNVRRVLKRLLTKWRTLSRISSFRKWRRLMEYLLQQLIWHRIWIKPLNAGSFTKSSSRNQP